GHSFHVFEAANLPYLFQRHPGAEMAEVASMSMELLSAPYIDRDHGGYYDEADAQRARRSLLERTVLFFTHCASVDAFSSGCTRRPKVATATSAIASGWSCAGASRAIRSIGAGSTRSASRAGTSSLTSSTTRSITSSTGSRSWARCRSGGTA